VIADLVGKRKAHSDRSCSALGETRRRCVDPGGWHQWRGDLSSSKSTG
jgi:hypothetical protein